MRTNQSFGCAGCDSGVGKGWLGIGLAVVAAGACVLDCGAGEKSRLVANPVAAAQWESPRFRGKALWPMFGRRSMKANGLATNSLGRCCWGVEDLPLCREYVANLAPGFCGGMARYRPARGKKDAEGKWIFYERIPEAEHWAGTYTLRDCLGPDMGAFAYSDGWEKYGLFSPRPGCPFTIQFAESRPCFCLDGEDRGDKEDFRRWCEAHPDFIGFITLEEIDSDSGNYRQAMWGTGGKSKIVGEMREDLERRFGVWKDRYDFIDFMKRCWDTEVSYHFGCSRFWPLYCNNQGLAHINAKLGAAGLRNEVSSSQGSPWTWSGACTRGASRQWGIPFMWYCATFYRGFRRNAAPGSVPETGDNKWPRNGVFTPKRPAYMGASLSLTARQKYYGWLIGAAMIEDEPWGMNCTSTTNGIPCGSPYAQVFNEVYEKSVRIDRGAPYAPIALLTPISETTSRGGYAHAVQDEKGNSLDQFNIPAYLFTLTPVKETIHVYPMCAERRRHGDEGCLFNSPFGEIWDLLTIDAGLETPKMVSVLKHYPAAFLAGTYRKGDLDTAALEEYVKAGGTLFLSCDYVEDGLVSSDLAGVDFNKETKDLDLRCSTSDLKPPALQLHDAYTLHRGVPSPGTCVLYTDEHGTPAAWTRDLGKGRVITTAARRSLPDYLNEKCPFDKQLFHEKRLTLLNGTAELTLLRTLLETVQDETIPVKVDGDIQWGVNQVKVKVKGEGEGEGWLVWLFNNKGIAKYIGEPMDVDPSKTATVSLSMRDGSRAAFRDADTGAEVDSAKIEVGPGAVRLIRVER